MAATAGAVLTGAIINIIVCLIGFLVFSWLRTWAKAIKYYDPKRYTPDIKLKPAPLPETFFGWIMPVYRYSEPDIIREAGLDTAIYIRLLSYGFQVFMWVSLWCLIAVLPVNATGGECDNLMQPDVNGTASTYTFTNFDHLSLANVPAGSPRMWMHVFSTWVITFILCKYLWQFSRDSVVLRIQFVANSRPSGPTHSVLVTDIPAIMEATNAGIKEAQSQELERKKSEKAAAAGDKDGKGKSVTSAVSQVLLLAPSQTKATKAEAGGSNQEVHLDIAAEESMDERKAMSANSPAEPKTNTLRQRKVYAYDLNDESLDPRTMAANKLASGATPKELVHDEMELVYGDNLENVQVVHDQSGVESYVTEYHARKRDLEDYLDCIQDRASRDDPLPPAKVTLLFPDAWMKERYGGGLMKKVDGLPFWRDRLLWLEEQILEGQAKARALMWPSAFITYKTRLAQAISATGLHQHDETTWRTQGAPEPRELVWSNLGLTSSVRSTKTMIWWVLFWLMTLFFMIPVVAIQGLIDVPKLSESVPGLSTFTGNVVVAKLIAAIVPGLVLKIFLALLPAILAAMVKASGAVSASEIDFGVVSRFFIFQIIVVFAGSTIGGSFFSQAQQWIADPTSVVSVLGTAIPQACTFFITYIWVNIGAFPITFIRIVGLVLFRLFTWLASSPRARDRVFQEQYTNYGTSVTGHTMIILLGTVFCLINPIITPSVFVYFGIAYTLEKYNGIYIYRRNYESSGLLWVRLLNQIMTALYIFQLVMIGLLAIKKFPYTVLIIPVIFPTIAFHMVVLNLYKRPWALMSLHDAAELDQNDKICDPETLEAPYAHDPEEYVSPVFKVYKGDLAALLDQIKEVEPRVAADVERRAKGAEQKKAEKKANKKGCF